MVRRNGNKSIVGYAVKTTITECRRVSRRTKKTWMDLKYISTNQRRRRVCVVDALCQLRFSKFLIKKTKAFHTLTAKFPDLFLFIKCDLWKGASSKLMYISLRIFSFLSLSFHRVSDYMTGWLIYFVHSRHEIRCNAWSINRSMWYNGSSRYFKLLLS